jgi:hypothetical protein
MHPFLFDRVYVEDAGGGLGLRILIGDIQESDAGLYVCEASIGDTTLTAETSLALFGERRYDDSHHG